MDFVRVFVTNSKSGLELTWSPCYRTIYFLTDRTLHKPSKDPLTGSSFRLSVGMCACLLVCLCVCLSVCLSGKIYTYISFVFFSYLLNFPVLFGKICCKQIKLYPQISIEPKYGALYSKKKVRVWTLSFGLWFEKVVKENACFFA